MNTFDSRTVQVSRAQREYVTSDSNAFDAPTTSGYWIQASVSHQVLRFSSEITAGGYVTVANSLVRLEPDLDTEFKQWEIASDQDLLEFESTLD